MYTNQCTKCNKVFETKNPKRIVCPECLYLNKASEGSYDSLVGSEGSGPPRQTSFGGGPRQGGGGYGPRPQQGGGGYGGPRQGGFGGQRGPRPMGGRPGPGGPPRKLLFPREVMMDIEKRYKDLLPLPNPDAHVKIAEAINIPAEEAMKVFFAINVIRQNP